MNFWISVPFLCLEMKGYQKKWNKCVIKKENIARLLLLVKKKIIFLEGEKLENPLEELDQAIYQICLWENSDADRTEYFKFLKAYLQECLNPDEQNISGLTSCTKTIFEKVLDKSLANRVEECFKTSFRNQNDKTNTVNTILSKNRPSRRVMYYYKVPSVSINDHMVRVSFFLCSGRA